MSPSVGQQLLEALAERGLCRTVEERLRLARVVERFDGTAAQFADAVAALVATNVDEATEIRRLVRSHVDPSSVVGHTTTSPAPPAAPVLRQLARPLLVFVFLLGLCALPFVVAQWTKSEPHKPAVQAPKEPEASELPAEKTCVPAEEPRPDVAPKPTLSPTAMGGLTAVALLLISAAVFRGRESARQAWNSLRRRATAKLPGPADYTVKQSKRSALLADADRARVERDMRAATGTALPTDELDVQATLERTFARGLVPTPVYKQGTREGRLLVLVEQSEHWQLWSERLETVLRDLRASAPRYDLRYLDAKSELVTRADGSLTALGALARSRSTDAVLVIAERGTFVDEAGQALPWVAWLSSWSRRAWLDPLAHSVRPQEHGMGLPHRFPVTPSGVVQAGAYLASGAVARSLSARPAEMETDPNAGLKLEFIRTIAGENQLDLAKEAYRRLFEGDAEDAARLLPGSRVPHSAELAPRRRLSALFQAASANVPQRSHLAQFRDARHLEERTRQVIVKILRESEPPAGSLAHLRWERDIALQELRSEDVMNRRLAAYELKEIARKLPPEELALPDELARWGVHDRGSKRDRLEDRLAHGELSAFSRGVRGSGQRARIGLPSVWTLLLVLIPAFAASRWWKIGLTETKPIAMVSGALRLEVSDVPGAQQFVVSGGALSSPPTVYNEGRRIQVSLTRSDDGGWSGGSRNVFNVGCIHAQAVAADGSLLLSNFVPVEMPDRGMPNEATLKVACLDTNGAPLPASYVATPRSGDPMTGTCDVPRRMDPGSYTIRAKLGADDVEAQVLLVAGKTETVVLAAPSKRMGTLLVHARTHFPKFDRPIQIGSFQLNGPLGASLVGEEEKRIELPAGRYGLSFPNPALVPVTYTVNVAAGSATTEFTAVVRARDGLVMVEGGYSALQFNGQLRRAERSGGFRTPPGPTYIQSVVEDPDAKPFASESVGQVDVLSGETVRAVLQRVPTAAPPLEASPPAKPPFPATQAPPATETKTGKTTVPFHPAKTTFGQMCEPASIRAVPSGEPWNEFCVKSASSVSGSFASEMVWSTTGRNQKIDCRCSALGKVTSVPEKTGIPKPAAPKAEPDKAAD